MALTKKEKIEAIYLWQLQESAVFKCEQNKKHKLLRPGTKQRKLVMYCSECDFVLSEIPKVVYDSYSLFSVKKKKEPSNIYPNPED